MVLIWNVARTCVLGISIAGIERRGGRRERDRERQRQRDGETERDRDRETKTETPGETETEPRVNEAITFRVPSNRFLIIYSIRRLDEQEERKEKKKKEKKG